VPLVGDLKEKVLVVGLGEVGQALFDLFKESGWFMVYGLDVDLEKMRKIAGERTAPEKVDVMHICYPCDDQEDFIQTTVEYVKKFNPKITIINSTVPPGTTQKIYELTGKPIVHSPVRGMHRGAGTMKKYIVALTKYVGGVTSESSQLACKHFQKIGLKTKILKSPIETELAKLFETTYRAWMIACFHEMHRISRHFNADFYEVVDFLEDTHRARLDRPVMFPGVIGGHCLIPNAKLLMKSYESEFIRLLLKSNEKRKKEIVNPDIYEEVEKIKKKVEGLQREIIKRCGEKSLPY